MEDIINEVIAKVENYEKRPVYGIQVNKSACRLVIQMEDGVDYRFTDSGGESMMLPLNVLLINSGNKTAIIKVYPREGENLLTKNAYANLSFTLAPDKDSGLNEYTEIAKFSLPENIGTLNLPYYEMKVPFQVKVPYDYTPELDSARNLNSIPEIEEKIIEKYNKIKNICLNLDEVGYYKSKIHSSYMVFNSLYDTAKKDIEKGYETKPAVMEPSMYNRELALVENNIIQYYAKNKIVALWQKNLKPAIYIKGNYKYSNGEEASFEGGSLIFLYWPEDSDELQVW